MTLLQIAQEEWEQNTTPQIKPHPIGKKTTFKHEFRQSGQAMSWLKWDEDCIEIAKFKTLQPGQGAAARLIEFLKHRARNTKSRFLATLRFILQIRLFLNAVYFHNRSVKVFIGDMGSSFAKSATTPVG